MATSTENFKFKKPDESDFYDVQDQNGNWDIADQELEKLNNPTFEDYTGDTSVPAASAAIEGLRSKSKLGVLLSNIKAAFKGACLIGHIVNNCVTDNPNLPLSAAQGKALMDAVNVLNTKSQERDTFKAIFTATKEFQISDRANNLDQLITSGLYNFNVGMNNSASGNGYGACLVFRGGDPNLDSAWWIIQIAFTTDLNIYLRRSGDTGSSWTNWSEIH